MNTRAEPSGQESSTNPADSAPPSSGTSDTSAPASPSEPTGTKRSVVASSLGDPLSMIWQTPSRS